MDFEQIIDRLYPRFIEYGKTREEVANAVRKMNYMQDTVLKRKVIQEERRGIQYHG